MQHTPPLQALEAGLAQLETAQAPPSRHEARAILLPLGALLAEDDGDAEDELTPRIERLGRVLAPWAEAWAARRRCSRRSRERWV